MNIDELLNQKSTSVRVQSRAGKESFWIPYLEEIKKVRNFTYHIGFNGGKVEIDTRKTDSILVYGATGDIPIEFLDDLNTNNISLIIHRRNKSKNYYFYSSKTISVGDTLTGQILARENQKKSSYIARTITLERYNSLHWLQPQIDSFRKGIRSSKTVSEIRCFEAQFSKDYWKRYYAKLGIDGTRRDDGPISKALDACSFFMSGIILRWILFHNLSPAHGYLHIQTTMPSLVYDLMEPYRYIFERAVFTTFSEHGEDQLIARSITTLKHRLTENIYCPKLRMRMSRKNLLHGSVQALQSYVAGKAKAIIFPCEGDKVRGGRKINVAYRIPGSIEA